MNDARDISSGIESGDEDAGADSEANENDALNADAPNDAATKAGLFGVSRRLSAFDSGPSSFSGFMVAAVLLGMCLYSMNAGLDLNQFDDLVRTNLAKGWSDAPFLFPLDMYWLPLPYALRGAFLIPFKALFGHGPEAQLIGARLPTLLFMWGAWRILAGVVAMLGGDKRASTIFTVAFLYNYGTFEFSSTTMSEPDSLLAIAAALAILVQAEARGEFGARRVWALGGVLALACMMRYENWSMSAAIALCAMLRWRREVRPVWRWAGLLLPAGMIAAWMAASWIRIGDPLNFLKQGAGYVDALGTDNAIFRSAKAALKVQPIMTPLGLAAGASFLIRRRSRPPTWWVALGLALLGLWTVFKLYKIATLPRYAWELYILVWVAAAPELQDWLDRLAWRLPERLRDAEAWIVQALALACVLALALIVSRQNPHIPPDLRRFTGAVNSWLGERGSILLRDCDLKDSPFEMQAFRALTDQSRLIDCLWVQGCDRLTADELDRYDFRMVIAKHPPADFAVVDPPISFMENGWTAWRIDPAHVAPPAPATAPAAEATP